MDTPKPYAHSNPLLSLSTAVHHHCHRLGTEIATRFEDVKRLTGNLSGQWPSPPALRRTHPSPPPPLFAWIGQAKPALAAEIDTKRCLGGTSLFTVSNTDNEFVLISDPDGTKSIGLLCFREVDAVAFLAQVKMRKRELKTDAKVVPISLEEIYNLKVEGIAFRFLPDPRQIKHALELKAADGKSGFDGVPVFQSDLLIVRKGKQRRYCPVYFQKEDLERDLSNIPKPSKGRNASHIVVGSLEDVLKKIEMSEKNSGWEDLVFIPPGASQVEHLKKVTEA